MSAKKHGLTNSKIYRHWIGMKQRCRADYPVDSVRKNYYERGITVCPEWQNFEVFYSWAIKNGYDDSLTLDRINNDIGYEPTNCRWVNATIQARNRRSNFFITYKGKTHCIAEWSEITGISQGTLWHRYNDSKDREDALFRPTNKKKR